MAGGRPRQAAGRATKVARLPARLRIRFDGLGSSRDATRRRRRQTADRAAQRQAAEPTDADAATIVARRRDHSFRHVGVEQLFGASGP